VLGFYRAQSAAESPALPQIIDRLVRIPYCLPDDEALVDRLQLTHTESIAKVWLEILQRTHVLGELFTLGLHPERFAVCEGALRAVLSQAKSMSPAVWIARLDEIATWWCSRMKTTYQVVKETGDSFRLTVDGPVGTTILAHSTTVNAPTELWVNGYQRVLSNDFVFQADRLPFIGLSPAASPRLADFLRQQGYIVETSEECHRYSCYVDQTEFEAEHERQLLTRIEGTDRPLIKLGRWPDGALSALAITGDIDALTLWDYGLRFFGR
jgi:hypothetical protein